MMYEEVLFALEAYFYLEITIVQVYFIIPLLEKPSFFLWLLDK